MTAHKKMTTSCSPVNGHLPVQLTANEVTKIRSILLKLDLTGLIKNWTWPIINYFNFEKKEANFSNSFLVKITHFRGMTSEFEFTDIHSFHFY